MIYLCRHGQTFHNREGRLQGRWESDLTPLGRAQAAAMGGHVRVGLEDSLWAGPGKYATSNAEQVRLARQIIEGLGLEIASPDEARDPGVQAELMNGQSTLLLQALAHGAFTLL